LIFIEATATMVFFDFDVTEKAICHLIEI